MKKSLPGMLALLLFSGAAPLRAEPGRFAAITALAQTLPAENPAADPDYIDFIDLSTQFSECSYDPGEMEFLDRLLAIFDRERGSGGGGGPAIIDSIAQMPEFRNMDNDPERREQFNSIKFGVSIAPGMTHGRIRVQSCRNMLRFHFDNGASRGELLEELERQRLSLESSDS